MSGEEAPRRGGGRLLVVLTGLFLVLACITAWYIDRRAGIGRQRNELLALFTADIRAEAAAIDAGEPPPDAENAAVHCEAAFAKWDREGWGLVRKLDVPWTSVPADLAGYVARNAAALAEAEKGVALDRCRFAFPRTAPGVGLREECYGPPAHADGMGTSGWIELFAIRARLRLEEGRVPAAAEDALRVPRAVRHALHRTVRDAQDFDRMIGRAGDVLERILRRDDLDAATARKVVAELLEWDRIDEDQAGQRRIGVLLAQDRLLSFLQDRVADEDAFRRQNGLPGRGLLPGVTAEDLEVLRARREKWQATRERAGAGAPPEGPPPPWMGKLTVLRAAFAIRARQLEKGAPPARLEDLVPDLLPTVPKDPWGTGPLRYEVRGDAWSVESVGKVHVSRRVPAGGFELVPLDLRIEWPPKAEAPR